MTDLTHIETKTKRRHRPRDGHMGRFVTDGELAKHWGLPDEDVRRILNTLDNNPRSGFPQKDPFFGDRRYLPAVDDWCEVYFDRKMGGSKRRTA